MGNFACGSSDRALRAVGRKGLVLAFALVLALTGGALSACSSSEKDPGAGEQKAAQQASIDVTVSLAAVEGTDIAAQDIVVSVPEGSTAYDALVASGLDVTASESEYGMYVSAIDGLEGKDTSGWVYTLNGEQVMDACDDLVLSAGDTVEWSYTTW